MGGDVNKWLSVDAKTNTVSLLSEREPPEPTRCQPEPEKTCGQLFVPSHLWIPVINSLFFVKIRFVRCFGLSD